MSTPSLNHIVSRFFTKPWENEQRYLYFYDFTEGERGIQRKSSASLFAKEGILEPSIEIKFRDLIETPLGSYITELRRGHRPSLENNLKAVRAIHLIFLAQTARVSEAADREGKSLTSLLQMEEGMLHALLTMSMDDSRITIAPVEKGKVLYYPQNGIFSFPVRDKGCPTQWTYGLGIPVTFHHAMLLVSKSVVDESLKEVPIAELSIGPDNCSRVVIPALIAEKGDRNYAIETMKIHRSLGQQIITETHSLRQLVHQAHKKMGFRFERVAGSIHNKVKISYPAPA